MNRVARRGLASLGAVAMVLGTMALTSAGAGADTVDRRAQIEKVRDGLNDPDPLVRLITLEDVAASKDTLVRSLALRQAIGIADPDLQAMAARIFVSGLSSFSLDLADGKVTGGDPERAKELLTALSQATLNFSFKEFSPADGTFQASFQDLNRWMSGQVVGLTITYKTFWPNFANCQTSLRIGEALDLAGTIVCQGGDQYVTANVSRKFY